MKVTRFLAVFTACLLTLGVMADDIEDAKKKINSIKKDNNYLYAEVTAPTIEEARDLAEEILYSEINEWAAKQKRLKGSPNLTINNKQTLWTTMSLPRGNMFRSFIYVKKNDILPVDNSEVVANPATMGNDSIEASPEKQNVPATIAELMSFTDYKPLAERIMQMKTQGMIISYDYYGQLPDPEACYLAIYNRQGKVVAFLSPGKERINLATGLPDRVGNYSEHGALGFIVKE